MVIPVFRASNHGRSRAFAGIVVAVRIQGDEEVERTCSEGVLEAAQEGLARHLRFARQDLER